MNGAMFSYQCRAAILFSFISITCSVTVEALFIFLDVLDPCGGKTQEYGLVS
jgi:hypothetical protein